jgi:hypothetical protein
MGLVQRTRWSTCLRSFRGCHDIACRLHRKLLQSRAPDLAVPVVQRDGIAHVLGSARTSLVHARCKRRRNHAGQVVSAEAGIVVVYPAADGLEHAALIAVVTVPQAILLRFVIRVVEYGNVVLDGRVSESFQRYVVSGAVPVIEG